MKITKYRDIKQIEDLWRTLFTLRELSPFQTYESQKAFQDVFYLSCKRWRLKLCYFVVEDVSNKAILPIVIDRRSKTIQSCFFNTSVDYYDILIEKEDLSFIDKIFRELSLLFSNYKFCFSKLPEGGCLSQYFAMMGLSPIMEARVAIDFPSRDYEDYYHSLSKHQRQNIRTAYNKLAREDIEYKIIRFIDVPNKERRQCQKIYDERILHHWGGKLSKIKSLRLRFYIHRLRFENPVNQILKNAPGRESFILYLKDKPVAFISGFFSSDGKVFYVPRLSTSEEMLTYSPGIVLLNEAIKLLLMDGLCRLDLTCGNEPYKYAMGGREEKNLSYVGISL